MSVDTTAGRTCSHSTSILPALEDHEQLGQLGELGSNHPHAGHVQEPAQTPPFMDTLISDIRFAIRSLVRSPSFALTAVLALGLGIGSTAGVFSLLEGVVLRPLSYKQPDRLVTIWDTNREKGLDHEPLSPVTFHDYRGLTAVFEDAAAWWRPQLNLADETGDPIRVSAVETSENLFNLLGVQPAVGRGFTVHDDLFGPEQEAIISHRLWQTRFGGDPAVIGRAIRLKDFRTPSSASCRRDSAFPARPTSGSSCAGTSGITAAARISSRPSPGSSPA